METVYITTPIYYATDKPHVGHAYTTLAADVLARYWRRKLGPDNVFFSVGTDEHGQKVATAIEQSEQAPQPFVDALAAQYVRAWEALGIESNFFIRTTHPDHIAFAQAFLTDLEANGYIYRGDYEGFYCVGCEAYTTATELVNGRCPDHPTLQPQQRKEENYFFKLSQFAPKVADLIESGALDVRPAARRNEVLARLRGEVHDISISRPGLTWGIPVPWDPSHTVYVWVEALLNYASVLTINGATAFWPPTVQLMGKEILWFHAAIWPALLLAAGRPLPKTIFAHGWFTVDGAKMSKTLGNVIDPVELVDTWGVAATRYFLLSAVPFGSDGDIQRSRFSEIYEADLANGIGNLLNRTVTLLGRAGLTVEPGSGVSCADVDAAIEEIRIDEGLKAVMKIVRDANQRLESAQPWNLLQQTDGDGHHQSSIMNHELVSTLTTAYRQLETIAAGLASYLPETSARIVAQLRSGKAEPLFPRREQ